MKTNNHREKSNHTRDIRFFSCGSHVCRHSSPRCVNQHLVVLWLIGITPNQQMVSHTLVHSSSRRERTMVDALLTSWSLVFPFHAASTFGMLRPTFVRHYKMPLAFALLHPHPLESKAELRDPVVIQGTRFVSQRWLCNLRRRRDLVFVEEVHVHLWLILVLGFTMIYLSVSCFWIYWAYAMFWILIFLFLFHCPRLHRFLEWASGCASFVVTV